jgi:Tol biopolymer transport system component
MIRPAAALAVLSLVAGTGVLSAQRSRGVVRSQLVWVDRTGKKLATVGELADLGNLELSPDNKRVAVAVLNETTGTRDLWLYDLATGGRMRLDSNVADENWLVWSPDGRRVAFNSQRARGLDLYQTSSLGNDRQELLVADDDGKWPVSWSPDGRFILFVTSSEGTGNDIWVLPLTGDRKPYPFLKTETQENWAAFSPNGRWVAYSSTESGQAEVYVTPFPKSGSKWLVSRGGGFQARWRRDGKELFFMAPDSRLMAAEVNSDGRDFEVSGVKPLFDVHFPYAPYHAFDVAADGQRFLVNSLLLGPGGTPRVAGLSSDDGDEIRGGAGISLRRSNRP